MKTAGRFRFQPLTPDRWEDFEQLFGPRGACAGCWCTWWRQPRAEFERNKGEKNKRTMKRLVEGGEIPGILAYREAEPVGWCSVAPRESFSVLARSRSLKPIDTQPVWSVVCFFIRKDCRRQGLSVALLRAAAQYVRSRGGRLLEGYPVISRQGAMPDAFAWTGLAPAFYRAGFTDCAQPSATRRIVRLKVG